MRCSRQLQAETKHSSNDKCGCCACACLRADSFLRGLGSRLGGACWETDSAMARVPKRSHHAADGVGGREDREEKAEVRKKLKPPGTRRRWRDEKSRGHMRGDILRARAYEGEGFRAGKTVDQIRYQIR